MLSIEIKWLICRKHKAYLLDISSRFISVQHRHQTQPKQIFPLPISLQHFLETKLLLKYWFTISGCKMNTLPFEKQNCEFNAIRHCQWPLVTESFLQIIMKAQSISCGFHLHCHTPNFMSKCLTNQTIKVPLTYVSFFFVTMRIWAVTVQATSNNNVDDDAFPNASQNSWYVSGLSQVN